MFVERQKLKLSTERLKVLKVVGEKVAQVVVESEVPIRAVKIDKIIASLRDVEDHVFQNKVVKQGLIHKQIFYIDRDNFLRHLAEDVPFMVTVDIPGVIPGDEVDVQNHLLDIDIDYQLTQERSCADGEGILRQKIVAHILVKVSEWRQVDVVTDVQIFPRINTMQRITCYNVCDN